MTIQSRNLGSGWLEPESAANQDNKPVYPYNKVTQTDSGHLFEMDDTPTRERVRLEHRTGTFIEMHPNGDEVHKVYGDGYEITIKDKNVLIRGDCSVTIKGDSVVNVEGNKIERVKGNYDVYVEGNYSHICEKRTTILSKGNMRVGAGADLAGAITGTGGGLKLYSAGAAVINSDLNVSGKIFCDALSATYSIDAIGVPELMIGGQITAGPYGFVSEQGGLSVGLPIAVPGTVLAAAMVNAPLGNFGVMSAIWMTDIINKTIYSTHIHPAPRGLTGTPILKMI